MHRRTPQRARGRGDLQAFADCPINLLRERCQSYGCATPVGPRLERHDHEGLDTPGVQRKPPDLWRAESLAAFAAKGCCLARCTVARLMRMMGPQDIIRGKPDKTTVLDEAAPCQSPLKAPAPNMLWLSDFTYVATCRLSSTWLSSSTPSLAVSSVGGQGGPSMRASSSMTWTRRLVIADPSIAVGSSTIPRRACYTSQLNIPSDSLKRASSAPSDVSAIPTTTLSPRRSTGFKRPKSHIDEDHGANWKRWSSLEWVDWFTNHRLLEPSGIYRQPTQNNDTMLCWMHQPWPHILIEMASGKPVAVQAVETSIPNRAAAERADMPSRYAARTQAFRL